MALKGVNRHYIPEKAITVFIISKSIVCNELRHPMKLVPLLEYVTEGRPHLAMDLVSPRIKLSAEIVVKSSKCTTTSLKSANKEDHINLHLLFKKQQHFALLKGKTLFSISGGFDECFLHTVHLKITFLIVL